MAITNFIPTVWSENLYQALDKNYIGVSHCNRDYEGEIKNQGSKVKICGVGSINVSDYTKNTDMSSPQALSDTVRELVIDQAKYFNFQIDDIDKAQSTPKLMDAAMKVAASALANVADRFVYSVCVNSATQTMMEDLSSPEDILDIFIRARELLYTHNVSANENVVLEVPPFIATMLLKEKIERSTDNTAALDNGYLGNIAGCKVFVSQNIPSIGDDSEYKYTCVMRTTRAVSYADQLSEIVAYRPERRFADAVKGLHLYGATLVYPEELVCIEVNRTY